MKHLIDTNAFLWFAAASPRLSRLARMAIEESDAILVSAVTPWELAIKLGTGRLELRLPLHETLRIGMTELRATELPIQHEHALRVRDLPFHHGDPFDRILVAQAQVEGAALITSDVRLRNYGVEVIW